ncbi:MAG: two-component regulator propeller domain-containing protein [Acidobacteriota bacterium]|nr:two-component regulator propeller domain-containing protein [Acidobacteriota bacterium]
MSRGPGQSTFTLSIYLAAVCCLGWVSPTLVAQDNIAFRRYSGLEGLSQGNVEAIVQGSQGFLWLGTREGLNRFDGYDFKVFLHDSERPDSISSNYISALAVDREGALWVGTRGAGLNRMEPSFAGRFQSFRHAFDDPVSLSNNEVNCLLVTRDGDLWVGTRGGLNRMDPKRPGKFEAFLYRSGNPRGLGYNWVKCLYQDQQELLWVGTFGGGLYRWDADGGFTAFRHNPDDPDSLPDDRVNVVMEDRQGRLWVGGFGGLSLLDRDSGTFTNYPMPGPESKPLAVTSAVEDPSGMLWLGSFRRGIARLDPASPDRVTFYSNHRQDSLSLSSDDVTELYRDQSGMIWIGTGSGGVNAFDTTRERFEWFRDLPDSETANTTAVMETRDEAVWIGISTGGLARYDRRTGSWSSWRQSRGVEDSLNSDAVYALHQDEAGRVWVGTDEGLAQYNASSNAFTRFLPAPGSEDRLPHNQVRAIRDDGKGRLWVGTGGGLARTDPTNPGRFVTLRRQSRNPSSLSADSVQALHLDARGNLWVGTTSGVNRLLPDGSGFIRYSHTPGNPSGLSHDRVYGIYDDPKRKDNSIWIATGGGLNRLQPGNDQIRIYTTADGLPTDTILGVTGDDTGNLWLSTRLGLVSFDPKQEKVNIYSTHSGLQGRVFNEGALFRGKSGRLYFGGPNGLNAFFPDRLEVPAFPPPVALTHLEIDTLEIQPGDRPAGRPNDPPFLTGPVEAGDSLTLTHRENILSLRFTALDFTAPERNRFRFRLENFESRWHETDAGERIATYTNLDHGTYTFRLSAVNRDGVPSDQEVSFTVLVKPPPWKTWWAYLLYGLGIAAVIGLLVYTQRRELAVREEANRRLETKVAERTAELETRNDQLAHRNDELQLLERIVEIINRPIDLEEVLHTMLEQGLALFPQAEKGGFLRWDSSNRVFKVAAFKGYDLTMLKKLEFGYDELLARYSRGRQLSPGIHVLRKEDRIYEDEKLAGLPQPASMLTIAIHMDKRIGGFLLLDNFQDPNAFDQMDMGTLVRFREHAKAAMGKANTLKNLVAAQEELFQTAHAAGMAETATEVLHNVGNILNSAKTSGYLIEETLREEKWWTLFNGIVNLLDEHAEAVMTSPKKRSTLVEGLRRIFNGLTDQRKRLDEETRRLQEEIHRIVSVLREQQEYARNQERVVEVTDLNELIHETIQSKRLLLAEKRMTLHEDLNDIPLVQLQRAKFKRVLYYLLNNAGEAIEECGEDAEGRVWIKTWEENGEIRVELRDNGIGIPLHLQDQIFVHGFTTKRDFRGFGLHYCANTMKEMSGGISIESKGEGKGTSVFLSLPPARVLQN